MQMFTAGLVAVALAVGALMPVQAGINSSLARFAGTPWLAAFTNTSVASLVLFVVIALVRPPMAQFQALFAAPAWTYCGGLIGAVLVLSGILLAPRLGSAGYVTATIAGTIAASILIDHFGLVGFAERAITWPRAGGAALVIAGMLLINRF